MAFLNTVPLFSALPLGTKEHSSVLLRERARFLLSDNREDAIMMHFTFEPRV